MSLQTTAALCVAAGLEPAIYPLPMIRRGPGPIVVDEAPWLFIVHDLIRARCRRAVFKPAQSWSQDFTQITMS